VTPTLPDNFEIREMAKRIKAEIPSQDAGSVSDAHEMPELITIPRRRVPNDVPI
jgi:hypothetical protein